MQRSGWLISVGVVVAAEEFSVELTPDLLSMLTAEEHELLASEPRPVMDFAESMQFVTDAGFVRRVTVLARSAPLHAMESKEAWQQFAEDRYDLRSLALAALDAVVTRQGMEDEATSEDVLALLGRLAQLAAPDLPSSDHATVARFVLKELLNDREGGAKFVVHYSDYRHGHRRVPLPFRLLEEGTGRRGHVVLRASVQAINALIGGLDLEVEDAQLAMDAVLTAQISRGQWNRAEESATKSMLLSVALAEKVRTVLAETEHDVRTVDWAEAVPALLDGSRAHLEERLHAEDGLMERMRQARNQAGDRDVRETCVRILALLGRGNQRHIELHGTVLRAMRTFLDAQADQRFRPIASLRLVAMTDEVLHPIIRMSAADADEVVSLFAEALAGPVVARLPRLADLYDLLLAPARESIGKHPDEDDPELGDEEDDAQPYTEAERASARAVLGVALLRPCRLSELLHAAEPHGPTVVDLVALSVLWAFAPEHDDGDEAPMEFDDLFSTGLVVLDDGSRFDLGGYVGRDLLVVPAPLPDGPTRPEALV
ncbi:hypothetical protein AB0M46_05460 [Dactylosporangium sp. NPDC051485]|uniref:hypothetical protein n=1 Tax=Dactylosporangium sp. NPDC051485 TaxID=3154846 RepID=UPI00342EA878